MTGLACLAAQLHAPLLHQRHLVERHLDAEIAAGHHQAVERAHDLLQRVDRLGLLDLRDDRQPDVLLVHDLVYDLDVLGRPHERQRDQVDAEAQREPQVLDVLLGQRRHRSRPRWAARRPCGWRRGRPRRPGSVMSVPSTPLTSTATLPSSISSRSPARTSCGSFRYVQDTPVRGALDVVGGDHDRVARTPPCGPSANRPSRIFGPCRSARIATARPAPGGLAHRLVHALVVGVAAVAEVQPGDVHAGVDEATDAFRAADAGPRVQTIFDTTVHGHQASLLTQVSDRPTPAVGAKCRRTLAARQRHEHARYNASGDRAMFGSADRRRSPAANSIAQQRPTAKPASARCPLAAGLSG